MTSDKVMTSSRVRVCNLYVFESVGVQVFGEVFYEVESVAHVDEGARLREVDLQQEVFHSLRVVGRAVAAYSFGFHEKIGLATQLQGEWEWRT